MLKTMNCKKALLLAVMLFTCVFGTIFTTSQEAYASSVSSSTFSEKLSSLRATYPNYSTWTGTFDGGKQCWGFARLIAYNVFGEHADSWTKVYSLSNVKAGDIIQYGNTSGSGHTVFVTSVSGNTITYVDCNGNGNYSGSTKVRSCGVKWDNTISKTAKMFGKYSFSYVLSSPGVTTNTAPVGCVDSVTSSSGTITVTGWAFDPDESSKSITVHIYVGSTCVGSATANVTRTDVNKAYGISGKHGFSCTIDLTDTGISGSKTVTVYAIDSSGGSNPKIGSKTVKIVGNSSPSGYLDTATGNAGSITITGWAYDKDSSSKSVTVHVYVGGPAGSGTFVGAYTANVYRSDVNKAMGISGNHGYSVTIDMRKYNLTGSQKVYVYAIDLSGRKNTLLTNSPKTVTIKSAYTITYNANGGKGAPASQTKAYGITQTLSSTAPTRSGYTFVGWNTKANGTGTTYKSAASYTGNASVTLYAQWKKK